LPRHGLAHERAMAASFLPSPPRPARGSPPSPQLPRQDRHPDKILLEGVDLLTTTICFGHWSKRNRQRSPSLQIWSGSGAPLRSTGKKPNFNTWPHNLQLQAKQGAGLPSPRHSGRWDRRRRGRGEPAGRRRLSMGEEEREGRGNERVQKKGCRWRFLVYDLGERTSLHKNLYFRMTFVSISWFMWCVAF
jgi:hypothetical protein